MRYVLPILLFPILVACGPSAEEIARLEAMDHEKCIRLGFVKGTDGYGNCRLQIEAMRNQYNAAVMGGVLSRPPAPIYQPPPPRITGTIY